MYFEVGRRILGSILKWELALSLMSLERKFASQLTTCRVSVRLTRTVNFAFKGETTHSATKTGRFGKNSFVRRSCQNGQHNMSAQLVVSMSQKFLYTRTKWKKGDMCLLLFKYFILGCNNVTILREKITARTFQLVVVSAGYQVFFYFGRYQLSVSRFNCQAFYLLIFFGS